MDNNSEIIKNIKINLSSERCTDYSKLSNIITRFNKTEDLISEIISSDKMDQYFIRSFAWKQYLGLFTDDIQNQQTKLEPKYSTAIEAFNDFQQTIELNRQFYQSIKEKHDLELNSKDDDDDADPLSGTGSSQSSGKAQKLKYDIEIDIDRTYQDKPLFKVQLIKEVMSDVLFFWSMQNPIVSYKQGMNDILAVVLYNFLNENQHQLMHLFTDSDQAVQDVDEEGSELLPLNMFLKLVSLYHLKADLFLVFDRLMATNHQYLFQAHEANKKQDIIHYTGNIFNNLLKNLDKELWMFLKQQKVEPQLFLLKQVRCLLTREFHLHDVTKLWDSILLKADFTKYNSKIGGRLDKLLKYHVDVDSLRSKRTLWFLDFICVSMIVLLREDIFQFQENSAILKRLMQQPPQENVFNIVLFTEKQIQKLTTKTETTAVKETKSYLDSAISNGNDDMMFFGTNKKKKKEQNLVQSVIPESNDFFSGNNSEINIDFSVNKERNTSTKTKGKLSSLISQIEKNDELDRNYIVLKLREIKEMI